MAITCAPAPVLFHSRLTDTTKQKIAAHLLKPESHHQLHWRQYNRGSVAEQTDEYIQIS
jgi:hypothetical protein